jgi:hypothetical protein
MEKSVTSTKALDALVASCSSYAKQSRVGRIAFLGHILFDYRELRLLEHLTSRMTLLVQDWTEFFCAISDLESSGLRSDFEYLSVQEPVDLASSEGWRSVKGFPYGVIQLDLRGPVSPDQIPWHEIVSIQRSTKTSFVLCGFLGDHAGEIVSGFASQAYRKLVGIEDYDAYLIDLSRVG